MIFRRTAGIVGADAGCGIVRASHALLVHLGDSRIYLHRAGKLKQLTRDHSVVQQMVDAGLFTPDEAAAVRSNGGPTQFIGMPGEAR